MSVRTIINRKRKEGEKYEVKTEFCGRKKETKNKRRWEEVRKQNMKICKEKRGNKEKQRKE